MDFSRAGSRRNRKNAVDIDADLDKQAETEGRRKKGRPSKGGKALRSKRYYIKNHLLVLQKRKLKRYMSKVIKIVTQHNFNTSEIKSELMSKCMKYGKRYHPTIKLDCFMHVLDMAREDRHLEFMNVEGLKFLNEFNDEQAPFKEDAKALQSSLTSSHSVFQFLSCTLLSAFLLVRHVQQVHTDIKDKDEMDTLIQRDCVQYYEITYDHIQPCDENQLYPEYLDSTNEGQGPLPAKESITTPAANDAEKPKKRKAKASTLVNQQVNQKVQESTLPVEESNTATLPKKRKLKRSILTGTGNNQRNKEMQTISSPIKEKPFVPSIHQSLQLIRKKLV